jgi:CubicO group peptidase (beta-lactamase class C family)
MIRIAMRAVGLVLVSVLIWLTVDYWRDPLYWRRWWDTMTHLDPAYLNLAPLEQVAGANAVPLPVAAESAHSIDDGALRAAEDYAARFDSFALIVVHRGIVQTEWYAPGWTAERLTHSQSMHKTVAALMLGAAIADGYVNSDSDPVGRYLTEWRNDPRGEMRLRDLLTMSSGLAQYEFTPNPFARDGAFRFLFSSDRYPVVLATRQAWEPGTRFDYNDVNAQLIGMIVERATGRRYAEYLSERLWKPIGAAPGRVWLDREQGGAMTACCLLAPAMSWARLGLMLKDHGRVHGVQVLPAAWIEKMIAPSPAYAGYGYLTWLGAGIDERRHADPTEIHQSEPYLATDLFMLSGRGGQRVYVSRALDLVVVRLGPFNGYQPLKPGWDNAYLFNTVVRGIRQPWQASKKRPRPEGPGLTQTWSRRIRA